MSEQKAPRGCVMQFEVDRPRWNAMKGTTFQNENGFSADPVNRLYAIAKGAACDVLYRGGTFVLVVTDKTITMIQRPDAEEV